MTEDQQPGGDPPSNPAPEGPDAPETPAAPPDATQAPQPPPLQPETPKRTGLRRVGYLLAGVLGVGGFLAWKFLVPLVLVGVAGQVFGGAFGGGPYNRLSSDVRNGFEQRFTAVVGDDFDDQAEAEQEAQIVALIKGGMPRLDDALVASNFRLSVKGMQTVDVATCAAIAKAFFAGSEPPDDASTKLIDTLTDAELQQWFEIRIQAIEAESRAAPPAVLISDVAVDPLYEKIFVAMNQTDVDTFTQMANGATVADASVCSAARGLYSSVLTLSPDEVLLFARYDVTP